MSKIENWSRADEVYEGNPNIIEAWEHDKIAQRVFVEKRTSTRGVTFYTVQQQNYPNGFDGRGYIGEVDNPTFDTMDEAKDGARSQLRRFSDGFTITGLTDIDVEDLPSKDNTERIIEADIKEDSDNEIVRDEIVALADNGILKDVRVVDSGIGVDKIQGKISDNVEKSEARAEIRSISEVGYPEITEVEK